MIRLKVLHLGFLPGPRSMETLLGFSKDFVLKNIRSNSKAVLDRWKPKHFGVVDRSESLRAIYFRLSHPSTLNRKPVLTISGAPGSGKTLLTALALNKIKPAPEDNNLGNLVKDVLDLREKEAADWIPIYLTFNDLSSIKRSEGADTDNLFRNRILYWLLTDHSESADYLKFLETFIIGKQVPSIEDVIDYLKSFNVKFVFFVDELRKLQKDQMTASLALTSFVENLNYEETDFFVFASSLSSDDFTDFTTESGLPVSLIDVKLISSFDELIRPLLELDEPFSRFLRADLSNVKMLKIFLWGCFGHARMINEVINDSIKEFSHFSRSIEVYHVLKEKALSKYRNISLRVRTDVKIIASAFCQYQLPDMYERMASVNYCEHSASFIQISKDFVCPFLSPFLMEHFSMSSPPTNDAAEMKFMLYLKDLFLYISEWTGKVIENPEEHGYSFEGFVPLWLRTYLCSWALCGPIASPVSLMSIFASSCSFSSKFEDPDVYVQPDHWLLKLGDYMLRRPMKFIEASNEDEVDAYRLIFEKNCENQKRFDEGQLIVLSKDNDAGFDFCMCMIGADGEPVYLFFELKYPSMKSSGENYNSIKQASRKHELLLVQFKNNPKLMGNYALVFFTLKKFKDTGKEIEKAGFPLIVFQRTDVLKLIGPSLGFIVPLHVNPQHFEPQDYFIQ